METTFITESFGSWLGTLPAQVWGIASITAFFGLTILMVVLIVWSITWKGLALWKAAKLNQKVWFIILLVVNTAGILEIIFYFLLPAQKKSWDSKITKNSPAPLTREGLLVKKETVDSSPPENYHQG